MDNEQHGYLSAAFYDKVGELELIRAELGEFKRRLVGAEFADARKELDEFLTSLAITHDAGMKTWEAFDDARKEKAA